MKLIIQELVDSPLEQVVTPDRNTIVEAIRPHLYRHNFATGSLQVKIYDSVDNLVGESDPLNIADIMTADFFHGYVRFYVNAYLKKDQSYKIKLVASEDYTFSEAAYIGWANGYDLAKYPNASVPATVYQFPLDLEIWERTIK